MAKAYANRVWMTTATTGTGTITLGSAKAGYLTFAEAGVSNADTVTYVLVDGDDFEIGTGTYTSSGTTMSRDTVTVSKISGVAGTTKLTLSGSAEVFLSARAGETAFTDVANNFTLAQQIASIELGHASDTTITRTGAGVIAVEGVEVTTNSGTQTLTNKTISADNNTISGLAASSFVLSNGSGNIDGAAAQKAIPSGAVVGTTDTQTLSGKTMTDLILNGAIDEEEFTIADAADFVIDPSNGSLQKITLGASRTPAAAPAGWTAGKGLLLKINDGTAYTITWTTLNVTWVGGTAPTLATSGWTVVALWRDADAIYGKHIGDVA